MNEITKTLAFAVVAVVLLAVAALATWLPDLRSSGAAFSDQGDPFFAKFQRQVEENPLAAQVLEVVEYDADTASVRPFQVAFKDGEWTVPSHYDYPADAESRLASVAAGVAEMKKDTIRSDRKEDHEAFGVLDPTDEKLTTLKGRGTLVRLRDRPGGSVLAEFILGNEVPGREGQRYIRLPGKTRVYGVSLGEVDLSTRFSDWIDTDLLDLRADDVVRLEVDKRKVDPDRGVVLPGETLAVERAEDSAGDQEWSMEGLEADQEVSASKISSVLRAVDNLRIVGVRPLPQVTTQNSLLRSLASRGFYLNPQPEQNDLPVLLSSEGRVRVANQEGIIYNLQFGEVTFATGEALTAGTADSDADPADSDTPEESAGQAADDGRIESRYLMVSVEFDPDLLPEEPEEPKSTTAELPENVFAKAPDDPEIVERRQKAEEAAEQRRLEREDKIAEGRRKVQELNEKYSAWYYVVPGDNFREVVVNRDALVQAEGAEDETSESLDSPLGMPPMGMPSMGMPPGMSLPPGHP